MPGQPHRDATDESVASVIDDAVLAAAMALAGRRLCVLTGAGVSTDSGIPDYRGEGRAVRRPLRHDEFIGSEAMRRRYWARAFVGWPRIRDAADNHVHRAVAALTTSGRASGCITQNVDGLHQRAGARGVVELHGALRVVRCLTCGARSDRDDLQHRLERDNPAWAARVVRGLPVEDAIGATADAAPAPASAAPDGDVDLDDALIAGLVVPACGGCGGVLKPDVVFFGDAVSPDVRRDAERVFNDCSALLVLGTSLEVLSGRRFVEEAARRRWPIVLLTRGATADHRASP
jgi:NAD-dependent SIR2 family protein deacetylase